MYAGTDARFSQRIRSAMEYAAYTELLERLEKNSSSPGLSFFSTTGRPARISAPQIVSIDIFKKDSVQIDSLKKSADTLDMQHSGPKTGARQINIRTSDGNTYVQLIETFGNRSGTPDLVRLDSLFTARLADEGIALPHQTEIVTRTKQGNISRDWLGEEPDRPKEYQMPLDTDGMRSLRITIENPNRKLLAEMSGIALSSLALVALIAFSFLYLLRTLFRQKSVEEMRRDFTHNITHELKTPIAVAYAANDALMNFGAAEDPARRTKYLGVVHDQLDTLSEMVQRILTMSIEEREDFRLRPESCDPGEMLEQLAENFRLKAPKPVEITVGVEPPGLRLTADRFHLNNVLGNMIDNALKYSGERVRIELRARRTEHGTEITVSDDGIGIPSAAQARIFDKFYRVPTGDVHDVKGFGLGLYYARLIVARHGGKISVESLPGRGSRFTITLPGDGR